MAYYKNIAKDYINYDSVENAINYICQPEKTPSGLIGGLSILVTSPEDMIMQFKAIKELFHKEDGKQVRHFVLSFSPYQLMEYENLFIMARLIAGYYAENYQIVYSVHEDSVCPHIHFVMNTVSFRNGLKFDEGYSDYYAFMNHIAIVTNLSYLTKVEMNDSFDID